MAIHWVEEPAWKYGFNAKPMDAESLMRRIYPYWSSSWELRFDANMWFGKRFYQYTGGASTARNGVTNPRGYATSAWFGLEPLDPYVYEGPIYTLAFPQAERKAQFYQKVTSFYGTYLIEISFRVIHDDGTVDTDVTSTGFTSSVGWNSTNLKNPGQFAISHTYAAETYIGFTVWGGEGGAGQSYGGDVFTIEPDKIAADLIAHNPDIDWGAYEVEIESPEAGPPSSGGGYSGYGGDITASDSYEMDPLPTASAAALGFINMYNPSAGGLMDLGEEIFPDFTWNSVVDPTGNDLVDAILNGVSAFVEGINQIPKMIEMFVNSRLIDYVQDCHIVPVAPTTGSPEHIKLGFRELTTQANKITTEYVSVDLGSINLTEFYHMFIDYNPFTRAKLFLPFVGYVPIEPEYFQDGTLAVKYKFNVYDGSFTANVIVTPNQDKISKMQDTVIGVYTGTAIVHIPLTGLNYSSMVAGLIGGAGAMMSSLAAGNMLASAGAALNTATSSPQVMSSNSYTASAAFLGQRTPFLIIERSQSHFAQNYQHDVGFPSFITSTLGQQSGFQVVKDIDLTGVGATDAEKDEIRKLLAGGVYV